MFTNATALTPKTGGANQALFALILTFSRPPSPRLPPSLKLRRTGWRIFEEKEQLSGGAGVRMTVRPIQSRVFSTGRPAILPLLGGEGRGEEELDNGLSNIGKLDFWFALILTFSRPPSPRLPSSLKLGRTGWRIFEEKEQPSDHFAYSGAGLGSSGFGKAKRRP